MAGYPVYYISLLIPLRSNIEIGSLYTWFDKYTIIINTCENYRYMRSTSTYLNSFTNHDFCHRKLYDMRSWFVLIGIRRCRLIYIRIQRCPIVALSFPHSDSDDNHGEIVVVESLLPQKITVCVVCKSHCMLPSLSMWCGSVYCNKLVVNSEIPWSMASQSIVQPASWTVARSVSRSAVSSSVS